MSIELDHLAHQIKQWGKDLGFADVGISDIDLSKYEADYFNWIEQGFHGEMHYMEAHGVKRTRPEALVPGTLRVISCRLNYLDFDAQHPIKQLKSANHAYISRYALNKDYHKITRKKLQQLGKQIQSVIEDTQYRAFCDSAPVLERPLAQEAGLGFIGKNSLLIDSKEGSFFFLGELFTNLPLPIDPPVTSQGCGPCKACIVECPTQAIIGDGLIDAQRCISYLTIEYHGIVPDEFLVPMGNRIYGCDDCQLVCPWNAKALNTTDERFKSNSLQLDRVSLSDLAYWTEQEFETNLAGSPIKRIGFSTWQRNLCIGLGNAEATTENVAALKSINSESEVVNHHKQRALSSLEAKQNLLQASTSTENLALTPVHAKRYFLPAKINSLKPLE